MKKVFIIAAAAIVLAACTYKSEYSSNRTPANLASLNVELLNNSGIAAALTLVDIDIQHKDTILTAGFDTLITPEAFAERFGYSITEMDRQHMVLYQHRHRGCFLCRHNRHDREERGEVCKSALSFHRLIR